MATLIIRDVGAYVNQYDLSGYLNQAALTIEAEEHDVTVMRNTNRMHKAGLLNNTLDLQGFVDFAEINSGAEDSQDQHMYSRIGLDTPIITVAPDGVGEDDRAYFGEFLYASYAPGAAVGDLLGFSLKAMARSRLTRGRVLNDALTPVTATGTTTKLEVGAITATQRGVAHLHVVAFDGTSLDVLLESDADGSAGGETTRATFAQATGVTSERVTVAGAVTDTFWRLNYTFVGTSVTFLVAFGVENLAL